MILVPRDTPGVDGRARHAGLRLRRPRPRRPRRARASTTSGCRPSNLIGEEGDGFAIAQARLGPGRIHHCMRSIGMAERAIELMCRAGRRAGSRSASRSPSRAWSATGSPSPGSRIEQLRLLVLKTAWLMDTVGNKGAHTEIQAIKIATPDDRRVDPRQGDPGARRRRAVSQDFPLAAPVRRHPHAALRRRPRRGAQERPRQGRAAEVCRPLTAGGRHTPRCSTG